MENAKNQAKTSQNQTQIDPQLTYNAIFRLGLLCTIFLAFRINRAHNNFLADINKNVVYKDG